MFNPIRKLNQKGQALMEYIMLLFIAVMMVMGLVYQFNDAFRQYLNAWFQSDEGGYLFCLIQNGYLPGESEVCSLPTFTLKNGKALSNGLGAGGASGASSASANASGQSNGSGGQGSGGSGGLNAGGRASEGGTSSRLIPANLKGSNVKGDGAKGAGGPEGSTGDSGFSSSATALAANQNANRRSSRTGSRYVPYDSSDDDSSGGSKAKTPLVATTERDIRAARLVAAEERKRKHLDGEGAETSFGFGNILKYVALFFVAFSLIFFVGSMLVAISRGGRKRE